MKKSYLGPSEPTLAAGLPVAFGTGLVALDVILNTASARPPVMAAGGTCGNVLAILSYLGWATFPVARLNGDAASEIVRTDLRRWGVSLAFSAQAPPVPTPVIVQTIRRDRNGNPIHRFSPVCPECGAWFPSFRAITSAAALGLINTLAGTTLDFKPRVFYFDRVSRGALILAEEFAARGAVIMFEPASVGDPKLFNEALSIVHILKYSCERLPSLAERQLGRRELSLEIETQGSEGLRYRSNLLRSRVWHTLPAIRAPQVIDTAGAGDWCTAGLLSQLATTGLIGFADARPCDLETGLRFGQAAAAIACCYEGARGAMYSLSGGRFAQIVATLLATELEPDLSQADIPAWVQPEAMADCFQYPQKDSKKQTPDGRRTECVPARQSSTNGFCPACG